jgi:hypothetical protein
MNMQILNHPRGIRENNRFPPLPPPPPHPSKHTDRMDRDRAIQFLLSEYKTTFWVKGTHTYRREIPRPLSTVGLAYRPNRAQGSTVLRHIKYNTQIFASEIYPETYEPQKPGLRIRISI